MPVENTNNVILKVIFLSEGKSMFVILFLSTRNFPKLYGVRTLSVILNSSLISTASMIDFR